MSIPANGISAVTDRQQGLSLVELMVSMVISLILLGGVAQIFLANKATYRADEALARMQENGRLGFDIVTRDVRQAGQYGCSEVEPENRLLNMGTLADASNQVFFDPGVPVTGYDYNGTGPGAEFELAGTGFPSPDGNPGNWTGAQGNNLPQALAGEVLPGSDVLVVQGARTAGGARPAPAAVPVSAGAEDFSLNVASGLDRGQLALISDCTTADLFRNTANSNSQGVDRSPAANTGNGPPRNVPAAQSWSNQQGWGPEAQIFAYFSRAYFIGEDNGRPALKVMDFSNGTGGAPDTLAVGVESLQLIYGVDNDAQPGADRYRTAAGISNNGVAPQDIVSVQMHLLTASLDPVRDEADTDTYDLGATGDPSTTAISIDPADDRRSRQVFSTTIALRNPRAK